MLESWQSDVSSLNHEPVNSRLPDVLVRVTLSFTVRALACLAHWEVNRHSKQLWQGRKRRSQLSTAARVTPGLPITQLIPATTAAW
jgi:hypothetical protein